MDQNKLNSDHSRFTPAREAICHFFESETNPVDYNQIINHLKKTGHRVNKTTIYRQLDFLIGHDLIQELDFGEGKKRYELKREHHHHLICTGCHKVLCVKVKENFKGQEEEIDQKVNFKITSHMLEFFGICSSCQGKNK